MASSTSLQVAGLASNFDWKSFVDQIMNVERAPADRLASEQQKNSTQANQLGTLGTKLSSLQTAAAALKTASVFGQRTASLSTSSAGWSASAATDTATGTYAIDVTRLATASRLSGASNIGAGLNPTSDNVSGLTLATLATSPAVTAGDITVNGKKVTVSLTDSLQDVFNAISTATGGNVTAAYDHTTDKVTLTSADHTPVVLGASNDTSNLLRALKLANNGTDSVTSSPALGSLRPGSFLSAGNFLAAVTAVDSSGSGTFTINGVEISFNVNTDTLTSVLKRINASTAGVTATYDGTQDRVVLANKNTGDLGISLSESAGGLLGALGLTSGASLSRGQNAQFSINGGGTLESASNTLDSSAHGIDGLSVTATTVEEQSVTVAADTAGMKSKVQGFIDAFNDVQQYLDTVTKISTDSKGKVTAAALSSNREIQEWGRSLRTMAFAAISGSTDGISRLTDMGLDFKSGTDELEIADDAKLTSVLANSTSAVETFFSTSSTGFSAKFDTFLEKITAQNSDQQERLNKNNDSLDEQIAAIERRLTQQREIMESAFIQMETAQSKLKQQATAVSNMFAQKSS